MPGSVTSVFSEPGDHEAALREEGGLSLLITGHGQFRARLTQVRLHRLRLSAAEEQLSRIAVPADLILVSLPIDGRPAPIWGGIRMRAGGILTLGRGERAHARTDGPSHSGSIWLPTQDLARYGRALIRGATFAVPSAARRRRRSWSGSSSRPLSITRRARRPRAFRSTKSWKSSRSMVGATNGPR